MFWHCWYQLMQKNSWKELDNFVMLSLVHHVFYTCASKYGWEHHNLVAAVPEWKSLMEHPVPNRVKLIWDRKGATHLPWPSMETNQVSGLGLQSNVCLNGISSCNHYSQMRTLEWYLFHGYKCQVFFLSKPKPLLPVEVSHCSTDWMLQNAPSLEFLFFGKCWYNGFCQLFR